MGYDGQFGDGLRDMLAQANGIPVESGESDPAVTENGVEFMVTVAEAQWIEETLGYKPTWMRRYVDDLILPEELQ